MTKLKIFLSYHKKSPIYKSEIFQPIQVGTALNEQLDDCVYDDTGDNISELNPYYCELTGHYWVLKNYLNNCDDDYVGFAHYRRLPDLCNISDEDYPSVFGINYTESTELFNRLNSSDIMNTIEKYDVILPCSVYMYANTVNPKLRETEEHYNVYDHFKIEHKNDLADVLKDVITEYYGDYLLSLDRCFNSEKSHFYNIYIMKTSLLKSFLDWQFSVLQKVSDKIGGWNQDQYRRMAGFVGEMLINVWLGAHKDCKVGCVPIYMVDFEAEYIQKANSLHKLGLYKEEIEELNNLLEITSDKFYVSSTILDIAILSEDEDVMSYLNRAREYAKSGEDYFKLAVSVQNMNKVDSDVVMELFKKANELEKNRLYADSYLLYAESTHNLELIYSAWKNLLRFDLTEADLDKYNKFMNVYNVVNCKN